MLTNVPSTKSPEYSVSDGVNLVPVNNIADIKTHWRRYVVIGAGKTGLDALLYLIENNVDLKNIVWIVPNDCWYVDREGFFDMENLWPPTRLIFDNIIESKDINDVYRRGEALGQYMRLDKNIWPTKMRGGSMTKKEMEKIRQIRNIIREGRIDRIDSDAIIFKNGNKIPTDSSTLHIDCSIGGSTFPPVKEKVFTENQINLQMIQFPPSATSAAMIASIELK